MSSPNRSEKVEMHTPGVFRWHILPSSDERGSFAELWRASAHASIDNSQRFVQANLSRSASGVLRGMLFHRRQADLWVLLEGKACAATTDLRGLARGGTVQASSETIEMQPGTALYIPRLVAHGFYALDDCTLLYLVSAEYDGTDELGFRWNDPDADIPWPAIDPVLSARDSGAPSLREVRVHLDPHISSKYADGASDHG